MYHFRFEMKYTHSNNITKFSVCVNNDCYQTASIKYYQISLVFILWKIQNENKHISQIVVKQKALLCYQINMGSAELYPEQT